MKQNVCETESNWQFRKIIKTCLQNKKAYLMLPSRHGHFHPILILLLKMVELPHQTCKYYYPLVVIPTITNCCKELHLKMWQSSQIRLWKRHHARNLVWLRVKTSIFFYYFEMLPPLSKVIVFSCVTFYGMIKYFWSAF